MRVVEVDLLDGRLLYSSCQFSPPHAFDVNVPKVLEEVRAQSYAAYVWPAFSAGLFAHNLLALSLGAALSVALFLIGFVAWQQPRAVFSRHESTGKIAQRPFGGAGFPRTCYAADVTGLVILHTLYTVCVKYGITTYEEHLVCELVRNGERTFWQAQFQIGLLAIGRQGIVDQGSDPLFFEGLLHASSLGRADDIQVPAGLVVWWFLGQIDIRDSFQRIVQKIRDHPPPIVPLIQVRKLYS